MTKELSAEELKGLGERFRKGVNVANRTYRFRKYEQCFVGSEATDWILKNETKFASKRADAIILGLKLMDGRSWKVFFFFAFFEFSVFFLSFLPKLYLSIENPLIIFFFPVLP
jgi:hypothetical protein